MVETFKDFMHRLGVDLLRLIFLFTIVIGLSSVDGVFQFSEQYAYLSAVLSSTAVVLSIAGISHIVRRILFPFVDLQEFAKAALSHPTAAAVVFLGICIVLSTFIVVNVMLLS